MTHITSQKRTTILKAFAIFAMVFFVTASAADAQQGKIRIHGAGVNSSTLGNNNAHVQQASTRLGDPIGIVESVHSPASSRHIDGTSSSLKTGSPIYRGDQLTTGTAGSVVLFLKDQSSISIDANSQLIMDELVYDPAQKRGSEIVSLIKGIAIFASGNIAKIQPDAMTVYTPVATIGIRGTTFGVQFRNGQDLTVAMTEDADGTIGEVYVYNSAGAVTLNQNHQATNVTGFNARPSTPAIMPLHRFANTFNEVITQLPHRKKRLLKQVPDTDRDPMRQLREDLLRR